MSTSNQATPASVPFDAPGLPTRPGDAAGPAAQSPPPPPPPPVLAARDVCKTYTIGGQPRRVVDRVDFHASKGECVFLCGPSGSGKSTLLSILGCLLRSDAGQVAIGGVRVDQLGTMARTQVRRELIGFVFQRFQLIRGLNAEDNVAVPLTMRGQSLRDARDRAGAMLKRIGLDLHRKQSPAQMSPGQCQRVALARAIIAAPRLLLADEPTAALDSRSGGEVMELMRELVSETQSATVVVTHDPRILSYADRVCDIENGRMK